MINKIIHFFYKIFHGPYPCGRTKENSYLCCTRKTNKWNCYLTKDKTEMKCRFCNHIKMLSSHAINKNNPYAWKDL